MRGLTMHEVGIAQNLLALAAKSAPDINGAQVHALKIRLGPLAGVSSDELRFGFEVAAQDTPFAGARVEVEETHAAVFCPHCQQDFVLADSEFVLCPVCAAADVRVTQGKELMLVAIEVAEDDGSA
jgi:hydrogenase nickel incorporation protein HypA/HybF